MFEWLKRSLASIYDWCQLKFRNLLTWAQLTFNRQTTVHPKTVSIPTIIPGIPADFHSVESSEKERHNTTGGHSTVPTILSDVAADKGAQQSMAKANLAMTQYMERRQAPQYSYAQTIILLQRAFRLKQYKKRQLPFKRIFTEDSLKAFLGETLYQQCKKLGVFINPPVPTEDNSINPQLALDWVAANPLELQPLARIVLKHINRVSFNKFQQRLRHTVNEFNAKLMQLPEDSRDYFIIISTRGHSNTWVLSLALQSFIKAPVSIIRTYAYDQDASKTLKSDLQQYPHARTALYLDDAIYSGRQISEELGHLLFHPADESSTLYEMLDNRKFTFYVGASYIHYNQDTYKNIKKIAVSKPAKDIQRLLHGRSTYVEAYERVSILPHVPMLPITMKLKSAEERDELKRNSHFDQVRLLQKRPLTFFAHKMADSFSIPALMPHGLPLDARNGISDRSIHFIPDIRPVYNKIGAVQDPLPF